MEQEVHIDRDDVIQFIRNGLFVALLAMVAVAAAIYLYRRDVQPTYTTTTTLYAADNVLDMRSVGLSYLVSPTLHVSAYRVAALSDPVLNQALINLGVAQPTPRQLATSRGNLSISTDADSRLIYIDASGNTGEEAAALANAVAQALMAWDAERPRANLMQMISGLQQRIADLDRQIDAALEANSVTSNQSSSLIALRSEQVSQLSTAVLLSDTVMGRLETVQLASIPIAPVAPSPVFESALGGILAFALAYLGLLLRSILSPRVRDLGQIAFLSGLPVLAAYPALPKPPRRLPSVPTSFLRAALTPSGDSPRVILLTGIETNRSVTRLSIGLAESFARAGFSTLLIGAADGSNELQARYELTSKGRNLLEVQFRRGHESIEPIPIHLERGVVLNVLPGLDSQDASSEQLANSFKSNIDAWTADNQIVVIDTPPLFSVADALTLTAFSNDVVIVLDKRSTRRKDLVAAVEVLGRHGAQVAGTVVTHVPSNQSGPKDFSSPTPTLPRLDTASSRSS